MMRLLPFDYGVSNLARRPLRTALTEHHFLYS